MQAPEESRAAQVPSGASLLTRRGTKASVLLELKRVGVATAAALAAELDCSLNTVRHHLKDLETQGLVTYDREHHGVGAPAHAYRLSAEGQALFPERYAETMAHLLDHLVELHGRDASAALLTDHYAAVGERISADAATLAREDRGEHIARALDAEGFMATWVTAPDGGVLTEHNCPHRVVAERFPEVCAAEEDFLARAFGARVERQSHIVAGCGSCSYHIVTEDPAAQDTP